jgi:S-adenosylmethionine/arginine decarboxylase-like enzyme
MNGWTLLALDVEAQDLRAVADAAAVRALVAELAGLLEIELPSQVEHVFAPQGVSHVRYGAQGRIALHTWPEWRLATIDVWALESAVAPRQEALLHALESRHGLRVRRLRLPGGAQLRPAAVG